MKNKTYIFILVASALILSGFFIIHKTFAQDDISGDHSMPEVCRVGQPGTDTTSRDLIAQHRQALENYQRLEEQIRNTPDTDHNKGEISRQLEEARALESRLKTQIETSMGAGGPQGGPSDACKRAVVSKEGINIKKTYEAIKSRFLPMMDQVNTITTEVETNLPQLKNTGALTVEQEAKIQADLATIKTEAAIVRQAFEKSKGIFESYIAKMDSEPNAAFEIIKNGTGFAGANPKASADRLTAAFKDLKTVLSQVKESNGTAAQ